MSNRVEGSPMTIEEVDLWGSIPRTPGGPFSTVGGAGHLYTSGETQYGLAETPDGDYVFCWLAGRERRDSAVRTSRRFQNPPLTADGTALVIGGKGNELFAIRPDGSAIGIGRAPEATFSQATWTQNGFAVIDLERALHLYSWSPGQTARAIGCYRDRQLEYIKGLAGERDALIACDDDTVSVLVLEPTGTLRRVADLEASYYEVVQCADESGRHMFMLPGSYLSDGGCQFELTQVEATCARHADCPEVPSAGPAATLEPLADVEAPSENAERPPLVVRQPQGYLPQYTRALLAMMNAKARAKPTPDADILELLTLPLDNGLYAYIHFRAHHDVGVVAVDEAWLDAPPKRVTDEYALEEASDAIELGCLANGDRVVARVGVPESLVELSHEEYDVRRFSDLEDWLADLLRRSDEDTDLTPFLE